MDTARGDLLHLNSFAVIKAQHLRMCCKRWVPGIARPGVTLQWVHKCPALQLGHWLAATGADVKDSPPWVDQVVGC